MAYMFLERNSGHSTIDFPIGGSSAIVDALVRGEPRPALPCSAPPVLQALMQSPRPALQARASAAALHPSSTPAPVCPARILQVLRTQACRLEPCRRREPPSRALASPLPLLPSPAGIQKHGGRVLLRSHVEEILVEGGRAAGVRLRGNRAPGGRPEVIRARKAVVSNASVWDTQRLLPEGGVGVGG